MMTRRIATTGVMVSVSLTPRLLHGIEIVEDYNNILLMYLSI